MTLGTVTQAVSATSLQPRSIQARYYLFMTPPDLECTCGEPKNARGALTVICTAASISVHRSRYRVALFVIHSGADIILSWKIVVIFEIFTILFGRSSAPVWRRAALGAVM